MSDCFEKVKRIAAETDGTTTQKLIAVLMASGVTSTRELCEITGLKARAVQCAKSALECAPCAAECAQQNAHAQQNAPKAQHSAPSRAYSEITNNNITNNYTDTSNVTALQPLRDLHGQLMDALGNAANAVSPGLMIVGEVQSWIDQGADRDLDVLDVIRAKARTMAAGSVNGWGYFRQPVAEAKARRERGLPSVAAPAYEQRKRLTAAEYMAEQRKLAEAAR